MYFKSLVRLSNIIAIISIILLIYWVFIFISVQVCELKVFRENITETFYMSIIGILALLFGSLIINIMFNLTRIAQKHNQDDSTVKTNIKKIGWVFALSFPLLFGFLFLGDYLTARKKEKLLVRSAQSIIHTNILKADTLVNYSFDKNWMLSTTSILDLLSGMDKNFPTVEVIVVDSIDNSKVFLEFRRYYDSENEKNKPKKIDFIRKTIQEEREYVTSVFEKGNTEIRFSAHDGNYELYYPYQKGKTKIVLYFSDHQRYGKIGS